MLWPETSGACSLIYIFTITYPLVLKQKYENTHNILLILLYVSNIILFIQYVAAAIIMNE